MGRFGSFADVVEHAHQASVPLSALAELTGRCNLDCRHCYLDLVHPPEEMTTAQWRDAIDQLAQAGTFFLTLTGGEIFLRRDALEIAEHARRRGMALRLFTNATRIDRALARDIARIRPMAVEVSLYAAHGEVHQAVTQRRGSLRRTLRGVALLRRQGVTVGLKAPLLALAASEIDQVMAVGDRLGCKVTFDPTVNPRRDGDRTPLEVRPELDQLTEMLRHPRLGALRSGLHPPISSDQSPCAIGRRTTRISPNGDVFPCPSYPVAAGNLRRQPFRDIWARGELLEHLRGLTFADLDPECTDCSQSGYCNRCLAQALTEHGNELGPDREACRLAEAKERALGVPPRRPGSWQRGAGGRVRLVVVR
jgi:radical SAM protein with 4Fe4S-binding SPASM domain